MHFTYKIIPKSLKAYELMIIYYINKEDKINILVALISVKYTDNELLKKFSILRAIYHFSPKFVKTDYDRALIKSLKNYEFLILSQ